MILTFLLLLSDIVSKLLARLYLRFSEPIILIPQLLSLEYLENRGAAFGILVRFRWFLILVSFLVSVILFYIYLKKKYRNNWQRLGVQFVLAGAFGNFIDRALLGYVVDFIKLPHWPTFNFADIFINIGVVFFIIDLFFEEKK